MRKLYNPHRSIRTYWAQTILLVLALVAVCALLAAVVAGAAPTYPPQTGGVTSDDVRFDTQLWSTSDPYAFEAIKYSIFYVDMLKTNSVTITVLDNYVTHTYLAGVVAADEIADAVLATSLSNHVNTAVLNLNVKATLDPVSGRWNLYQTK